MRNTNTVVVQNKILVVKERSEQFKYQRLCRLARRVLCATVTTAGVERIFSTAGFIVSSRRTSLGDSLFESLLFNKLNGDLRTFNTCLKEMVLLESGNYRNLKRIK